MKYAVYILKSTSNGKYYIGQTSNIEMRINRHNSGNNKSTKSGVPWELVYKESFDSRSDAFKREQQIKRYKGGRAFKALLELI